ncbi:MAG TPA: hypothetical protein VFE41_01695 [Acetobacteraceae bacterium]|jgi:hypothetical protein|nr:hypothetical protein [Acetobacteraceae bacterium]
MPRKTSSRYAFVMPKTVRRRSTYEQRTRQLTRGAKVLCQAVNDGPVFIEDQDGNRVRQWTREEVRNWRQFDVAPALTRTRIVEIAQLLGDIPLSAIKNAIYNGWCWIVKDQKAPFYWVTKKAQRDLNLPAKDSMGRTLKLLDTGDFRDLRPIPQLDRELAPMLPKVPFTTSTERTNG